MDLQDFKSEMLYFDEPLSQEIEALIQKAADVYGPESEKILLEAYAMAPTNLSVLVGLYRYYYYQHRYQSALDVAYKVMGVIAEKIHFPDDWRRLCMSDIKNGILVSFTMVRFYLFALKAAGYVSLRLLKFEQGKQMIEKVVELDTANRLGAKLILDVLKQNNAEVIAFPKPRPVEVRHEPVLN